MADTEKITNVLVHMYKMGTGDCFVLKFRNGQSVKFKMLIDCGVWQRTFADIRPFIETLRDDLEGHADLLVVTHEHLDHVRGFEAAPDIFETIKFDHVWMGWSEEDGDPVVEAWKENYAERKAALAVAATEFAARIQSEAYHAQYDTMRYNQQIKDLHLRFSDVLSDFAALHVSGELKDGLKGMKVVKEQIIKDNVSYLRPGMVIDDLPRLPGIRFFVLGPPLLYEDVSLETGTDEETYKHNTHIGSDELLLKALQFAHGGSLPDDAFPFDKQFVMKDDDANNRMKELYEKDAWRKIDYDWLMSAGSLALRMNDLTNNLSVALAMQVESTGKVLLFPGDAEIGSWRTWQDINWAEQDVDITTADLLRNTVFYKVAHHLSHNGTAKSIGLDMMTHRDLSAMATLDYNEISSGWKSTMPNQLILKDLLKKTAGRLMVMNLDQIRYDRGNDTMLADKIDTARSSMSASKKKRFDADFDDSHPHYMEYMIRL